MSEEQHGSEENGGIRINKFLASCGIDSRRVADRLIEEGRVEVNGKVIDTPGMRVTEKDFVKVDGRHSLYFEQCGNPNGKPVVILHGGPGAGCSAKMRRFHDPAHYRIVLFDQRGAGRSTPHADLVELDRCGHWPHWEHPDSVAEHLGRFLQT